MVQQHGGLMRGRTFLPNSAGSKNCREFHIPGPPVSVCAIPTSLIADEKRQGRSCVGTEYVQTCLSLLFPKQLGMTTMHRAFETVCRAGEALCKRLHHFSGEDLNM